GETEFGGGIDGPVSQVDAARRCAAASLGLELEVVGVRNAAVDVEAAGHGGEVGAAARHALLQQVDQADRLVGALDVAVDARQVEAPDDAVAAADPRRTLEPRHQRPDAGPG